MPAAGARKPAGRPTYRPDQLPGRIIARIILTTIITPMMIRKMRVQSIFFFLAVTPFVV